jgi:tripartite-type tricarboxylate transporter receptor subunit TctC
MLPVLAFAWQPDPKQTITVLLPTSPGSGGEITARLITKHIEKQGIANFSIEHKAGADGNIMLKELLESKPDGYTVGIPSCVSGFLFSDSHFTNLIKRSPLDLSMVTNIGKSPMAFVAHKDSKINNMQQLIAEVKTGKDINFAVGGSAHYLTFEYFTQNLKVDKTKVIPVVFKGPVPAVMSVAQYDGKTGTEYGIMPIAPALPLIQSGKVKLLALAGERRLKGLPDNVSLAKDFVPGLNVYGCWNFVLPPNTPTEIVEWYTKHVIEALNTAEYKKFMEENYIFLDKKSVGPENILKEMVELRRTWKPYVESLPKPN